MKVLQKNLYSLFSSVILFLLLTSLLSAQNNCPPEMILTVNTGERIIPGCTVLKPTLEVTNPCDEGAFYSWTSKKRLIGKLLKAEDIVDSDSELGIFSTDSEGENFFEFSALQQKIEDGLSLSNSLISQLELLQEEEEGLLVVLRNLKNELIIAMAQGSSTDALLANIFQKKVLLSLNSDNLASIYSEMNAQTKEKIIEYLGSNDALGTIAPYEKDLQLVLGMNLNNLKSSVDFSKREMNTLKELANNCPYEGGDAVYQARGLIASILPGLEYNDEELCTLAHNRDLENELVNEQKISIYPNPATDILKLDFYRFDLEKEITLEFVNSLGRIIDKQNISEVDQIVDISKLPKGIYFCKFFQNKELIQTTSFVKQ